jgi:hypothetical protein
MKIEEPGKVQSRLGPVRLMILESVPYFLYLIYFLYFTPPSAVATSFTSGTTGMS